MCFFSMFSNEKMCLALRLEQGYVFKFYDVLKYLTLQQSTVKSINLNSAWILWEAVSFSAIWYIQHTHTHTILCRSSFHNLF